MTGYESGTLRLVGTDEEVISLTIKLILEEKAKYENMSQASNPYGDGFTSEDSGCIGIKLIY